MIKVTGEEVLPELLLHDLGEDFRILKQVILLNRIEH
jgi:hypothetical protein